MKKVILTVAAIFAFGFVSAQDKMSFGAKGGLNVATLSGDDEAKSLIGFHVGGFVEFMISDKFGVQPEVVFSAQGAKYEVAGMSFTGNLNYINIPVMAKYFVTEDLSLEAGPQVGFLMSAKFDGEDAKDGLNSTDFGVNFGAGFNLNENMVLGLRYNLGLSEIEKDLPDGVDGSKNAVLQLSFGYKF